MNPRTQPRSSVVMSTLVREYPLSKGMIEMAQKKPKVRKRKVGRKKPAKLGVENPANRAADTGRIVSGTDAVTGAEPPAEPKQKSIKETYSSVKETEPAKLVKTTDTSNEPSISLPQSDIDFEAIAEEVMKPVRDLLEYEKKLIKAYEICLAPPEVTVGTTPYEVVWEEDGIRLLHYLPFVEPQDIKTVPLLMVYALINRPYILDLQPDRSVVRQFLRQGIDCYLIDWGVPDETDKYRDTNDYVNYYIDSIVDFIRKKHGLESISILGYCMGGTYSVLYSCLHPEKVRNLIVMAAGIDWSVPEGMLKIWSDKEHFHVDKIVDAYGNVPGEFLNGAFMMLSPLGNAYTKYLDMIDKVDDEMFIANFLRMEKWIRDGIPLPGEAYREFIKNAYQENKLVKGEWVVGGKAAKLENINMPVLNLIGEKDTLIPPNDSLPLLDHISSRDKTCISYKTGHIGLSVGSKLHKEVWPQVVRWLKERSDLQKDNADEHTIEK